MKLSIIITFFLSTVSNFLFSQNTNPKDIDVLAGSLVTKLRSLPNERILLQTNKLIYTAGETLWVNTLLVDSLTNRLINQSKIVFIDLIDAKDSVIETVFLQAGKLQLNAGIHLNNLLGKGYYWLRAYTKNMLEKNIYSITVKPIFIIGASDSLVLGRSIKNSIKSANAKISNLAVDIYPEGGSIISGTNSTVGINIHDKEGNPLEVSGIIKNNRDNTVASFSTNNKGLAKFTFEPNSHLRYILHIKNNDHYDSVASLPRINFNAAQLSVSGQNDRSIKVRVMLEDSIFTESYTTYILAISRDSLCFAGVGRGIYELDIPVSNFPKGIAHLLLYNVNKELLSVRNIYVNKSGVMVTAETDKKNYGARESVKLTIHLADDNGKPVKAVMAVSVNDSHVADTTNPNPIYNEPETDLRMLTSGIDYDQWKIGEAISMPGGKNKVDEGFYLTGKLFNNKHEPIANQNILLMANEKNVFYQADTTTNIDGSFHFNLPVYDDSTQFNMQVNDTKGQKKEYHIIPDPIAHPVFTTPVSLKQKFNDNAELSKAQIEFMDSLFMRFRKELLPPVTIAGSNQKDVKRKTPSGLITQEMLKAGGVNNAGDAILRSGKFHLVGSYLMSGSPNGFQPAASDEPIVVVDGSEVPLGFNGSGSSPVLGYLKGLPAGEIEYLKVLSGLEGSGYGVRGGHGVIEIHTSNKIKTTSSGNGMTSLKLKGFHVLPIFKMPDYTDKEVKKTKGPDTRTTIYWNGDIVTDDNGNAAVSFFTADLPAIYYVTVTGISASGENIFYTTSIGRK